MQFLNRMLGANFVLYARCKFWVTTFSAGLCRHETVYMINMTGNCDFKVYCEHCFSYTCILSYKYTILILDLHIYCNITIRRSQEKDIKIYDISYINHF